MSIAAPLFAASAMLAYIVVEMAFVNDKRRGPGKEVYAGIHDDEVSPLGLDHEPVAAGSRVNLFGPIEAPAPFPPQRRSSAATTT